MKLKHLLPIAMLAAPAIAMAVPAEPGLRTMTNPDGSTTQIYAYGDEFFHYYTDASGKYLLNRDSRGYWTTVERAGKTLTATAENINLLRSELDPIDMPGAPRRVASRMAPLDGEGRTKYNTIGSPHALVILVEFSDKKFSIPNIQEQITRFCNEEGYSDYGSSGSVRDYFKTVSGGKFTPIFDVSRVVTLSNTSAYYATQSSSGAQLNVGYLIQEAVNALDDEIDFTLYDGDNDNKVDNIYFFYAGHGQADTHDKTTIWPHQGHYSNHRYYLGLPALTPDGKIIDAFAIGNELKATIPVTGKQPWLDGIGTFTHEYGHVLGLPDMYDAYSQSTGGGVTTSTPGKYDVMDNGSYNNFSTCPPSYSAYEKWLCRWLDYIDLEDGNTYTVPAHTNGETSIAYRARVPLAGSQRYSNEYYVIETREKSGWDYHLPEHGMYIWHVDFDSKAWSTNTVNTGGRSRYLPMASNNNAGRYQYAWPGQETLGYEFTGNATYPGSANAITPANYSPDFHFILTNIAYDEEKGESSFEYNMITEAPEIEVKLHEPTIVDGKRSLRLSWDAVPDAQHYYVTLKRIADNKVERVVNNLDEKNVGNVTELYVENLTEAAWKQLFRFYVRAHKYIPASNTSEVMEFRTEDLKPYDPAGVEEIETNEPVSIIGGKGFIEAPASASIYTINGVACGRDNLPAGIYIVVCNGKSSKVVVK